MGIDYLSNKIPWLRILIIRHSLKEPFICLISRYILRSGQRGRCCFCAACPNRKMYLDIRNADEGLLRSFGGSTHGMNFYHPSQPHINILLYQHFMRLRPLHERTVKDLQENYVEFCKIEWLGDSLSSSLLKSDAKKFKICTRDVYWINTIFCMLPYCSCWVKLLKMIRLLWIWRVILKNTRSLPVNSDVKAYQQIIVLHFFRNGFLQTYRSRQYYESKVLQDTKLNERLWPYFDQLNNTSFGVT